MEIEIKITDDKGNVRKYHSKGPMSKEDVPLLINDSVHSFLCNWANIYNPIPDSKQTSSENEKKDDKELSDEARLAVLMKQKEQVESGEYGLDKQMNIVPLKGNIDAVSFPPTSKVSPEEILAKMGNCSVEEINDSEPVLFHQGEVIEAMKEYASLRSVRTSKVVMPSEKEIESIILLDYEEGHHDGTDFISQSTNKIISLFRRLNPSNNEPKI